MAKLMTVLLLRSLDIEVDGKTVRGEAGKAYDLDVKQAKALVKAKDADDSEINIAYHRGDLEGYERLLAEAAQAASQPPARPNPGPDLLAEAAKRKEAIEKLKADAAELQKQADAEQDPEVKASLHAEADELLDQAAELEAN